MTSCSPAKCCSMFIVLGLAMLLLATTASASDPPQNENHTPAAMAADPGHAPQGADAAGPHNQQGHAGPGLGAHLPLWSCLPFAGMLLSIALWPLIGPSFWHHHFAKISFGWALLMAVPFLVAFKGEASHLIIHIILADYVPFIILLWSLFTVSGGILLRGTLNGTPAVNTLMLLIGTSLASWMGTTGAAMLMIRPFLRANKNRQNRTFMVVFFIFLVGNIGGSLTPLGDPPLFLGFLHGVDFFWTFNIAPHMLTMVVLLVSAYFLVDTYQYRKERSSGRVGMGGAAGAVAAGAAPNTGGDRTPLTLEGKLNFLFLAGIVGAVLLSGVVDWGEISILEVHRGVQDWVRDLLLILMGALSILLTSAVIRQDNEFSWFPIKEVAYLFIGIFITMIPCLLILKSGSNGALAFLIKNVSAPAHYFWASGTLSSFLDNAPTYLTFFNTALGSFFSNMSEAQAVPLLMTEKAVYLKAVSAGSVFFGACSYIGNAPNFMVRSIAEESGTPMPSFFGYILKYTLVFLVPCFILITLIFF